MSACPRATGDQKEPLEDGAVLLVKCGIVLVGFVMVQLFLGAYEVLR